MKVNPSPEDPKDVMSLKILLLEGSKIGVDSVVEWQTFYAFSENEALVFSISSSFQKLIKFWFTELDRIT